MVAQNILKQNTKLGVIYLLLAFPLFYFVYKYSSPYLGMIDFFDYYKLYKGMDYQSADSPLNMRLVSSFFVYLMSNSGLHYDTACYIDNSPIDKVVYFNAILFNYICVVLTCVAIFNLCRAHSNSIITSFVGGLVYLLGFGTIFFELIPLTDAFTIFIFTLILFYYNKKSHWVLLLLVILVLQREYVFLAFGLLTLIDWVKYRNKYYLYILIYNIICFSVYIILRKLIFETQRYSHHTSVDFMIGSLASLGFPIIPFVKQTLITMNIFIIYGLLLIYKYYKKMEFNRFELVKCLLLLVQIILLSFLLALGNNAGRYFYILVPLIIVNLINELKSFNLEATSQGN